MQNMLFTRRLEPTLFANFFNELLMLFSLRKWTSEAILLLCTEISSFFFWFQHYCHLNHFQYHLSRINTILQCNEMERNASWRHRIQHQARGNTPKELASINASRIPCRYYIVVTTQTSEGFIAAPELALVTNTTASSSTNANTSLTAGKDQSIP